MTHLQIKNAARKYADEFTQVGESALMLKLTDAGIDDIDAEDIIDKIKAGDLSMPGDKNKKPPLPNIEDEQPENQEIHFWDEWQVQWKKGTKGNVDEHFDKVKLIKTVRLEEERIAMMNEQSVNSRLRYYPSER